MYEVTLDIGQLLYYAAAAVATYYALQFSSILLPTGGERVLVSAELAEPPQPETKFDLLKHEKAKPDFSIVKCWDPSTLTYLGEVRADTKDSVELKIKKCRAAQEVWAQSTFAQRRQLMKTMLRFVVENQATIAKVAVRDSGKTVTDAIFGEVLVTCEKLKWLAANGESVLQNEKRATGSLVWFTKNVWVEYRPLGVRLRRPVVLLKPSHWHASSPGMMDVGGFFSDFEAVRTVSGPSRRVRETAVASMASSRDSVAATPSTRGHIGPL